MPVHCFCESTPISFYFSKQFPLSCSREPLLLCQHLRYDELVRAGVTAVSARKAMERLSNMQHPVLHGSPISGAGMASSPLGGSPTRQPAHEAWGQCRDSTTNLHEHSLTADLAAHLAVASQRDAAVGSQLQELARLAAAAAEREAALAAQVTALTTSLGALLPFQPRITISERLMQLDEALGAGLISDDEHRRSREAALFSGP